MCHHLTPILVTVAFLCCTMKLAAARSDPNEFRLRIAIPKELANIWLRLKHFRNWWKTDKNKYPNATIQGRTFGMVRRLKLLIPAVMYKMGVITTLLGFLTLFALKGLFIGIVLLVLQLSAGLAKLTALKSDHHHQQSPQNIHVHIHPSAEHQPWAHKPHYYSVKYEPDSSWSKSVMFDQDPQLNWDRIRQTNKMDNDLYLYSRYKDIRDSLYAQEL